MAEVTAMRNNALPYPVYGVPYVVVFPLIDADGDPVTGATCDSEVSKNGDTGADCTNEGVEITFTTATNKGQYYLILTASEMTADVVTVNIYASTAKATVITLYPRKLVSLRSGTSQGGAAGYITLDASAGSRNDRWNGCLCVATIDSNVECRIITDYTGSNQQAAVVPNWNVTPDSDDTFIIYLPEGMQNPTVNASHWNELPTVELPLVPTTAGRTLDVSATGEAGIDWANIGSPTTTQNLSGSTIKNVTDTLAVNLAYIIGTGLTETVGSNLANAFKKFFDKSTPTGTVNSLPDAVPDASGGLPVTGTRLTSIPWNTAWDTEVQSEVQDAIEANHLDHLLAQTYDPASKPGAADALLNELIGDDAGVSQFTANALELGPSGGGLDAAGVRAAVGLASANLDTQLGDLPTNSEAQAMFDALNQSASRRVVIITSQQWEIPESGSNTYRIQARTYDGDGALVNADSTPTLTATGGISGSLAANLSSATNTSTGVYDWTYTLASGSTQEQVTLSVSPVIGGNTFTDVKMPVIADFVASTWTSADRTTLNGINTIVASGTHGNAALKTLIDTADTVADAIKLVTDALGATAAALLKISAETMKTGTVDHTGLTATGTQFESDDITTPTTADHWKNRVIIFTSGDLQRQVCQITASSVVSGRTRFTVSTLTSAPADNVTFVIV